MADEEIRLDEAPSGTEKNKGVSPKVDPAQLAELERELLEKVERQAEHRKIQEQAEAEMAEASSGKAGSAEQALLLLAAAIMLFSLPFLHYVLATALTLFAIFISLLAGLASPRYRFSAMLNLGVALAGLLFFELSAVYTHTIAGIDGLFLVDQVLAFTFLLATYFSARTFRRKAADRLP